ncbi:hypothetical protein D1007_48728 [Hordeum vulgare]|uniref:FAS1 domain-containing protein n=1 Tax=Hordeum vulgare subsp. vulgare TaxID=112509 RepID=A0A8I6Y0V9_HORVV|nr:uncharacterized protein LOC123446729 [Hordeum vulgare subsp. vulgare]KAE8778383.1 hypothetical protein D1007_48728 [Hordeum vulgare]
MSGMMAAGRSRMLVPLRPRPLWQQWTLLAGLAAAFTVTLLSIVLLLSSLPASSSPLPRRRHAIDTRSTTSRGPPAHCSAMGASLGEFGDMMVSMLPRDLAFTAFVPSPESFRRVLRLRHNDSAAGLKPSDDTYAVVSRVLGFSAVPRRLRSEDVAPRGTARLLGLDSVSGLKVRPWRDVDGALVVNGVRSECVDIVRDETVVHVMAGVLMDAEFERSLSLQN